ncbi:trypsin-like peptidase domain-containing protein [Candidatus Micrarchaeota archaeon]|nr:trypsin-like peptidase domain-containing protein [Candidatus Micrarchaeota archaeon]
MKRLERGRAVECPKADPVDAFMRASLGKGGQDGRCQCERKRIDLIDGLLQSVVLIRNRSCQGSGVIIFSNRDGALILTNRHVVDPSSKGTAAANMEAKCDSKVVKVQRVLVAPKRLDLALVTLGKRLGPPVEFGGAKPPLGADVLVIGSPHGLENTVSKGIVSNFVNMKTRSGLIYEMIQTDAAVSAGNSGGGLFELSSGDLIGVPTCILPHKDAENIAWAIPITILAEFPPDNWREIHSSK